MKKSSSKEVTAWYKTTTATWVIGIVGFFIVVSIIFFSNKSNDTQQSQTNQAVLVKPTQTIEDPKIIAYKAKIKPIIQEFEAEDVLIDTDKSKLDYRNDPVYIHADQVYRNIEKEWEASGDNPKEYDGYVMFLSLTIHDMVQFMDNMTGTDASTHVSGFSIVGVKTCEEDIKIAEKMNPKYGNSSFNAYSGYDGKIEELQNLSIGKL